MKATLRFTAVPTAALFCVLMAPAMALATGTAKDPYGEKTPLNLPADGTTTHADVGSGSGSLARTFIGLAVVVAVIYGLTWVLRQMKASKEERSHGFGLATEASMPLGPGRSVHLIRAGRELVLVGSAEQGIVPIRTYTEDEARALGLLAPPELESGDGGSRGSGGASGSGSSGNAAAVVGERLRQAVTDVLHRLRERTVR